MDEHELLTPGDIAKRLGVETCAIRELDNWRLTPVATVGGTRYLREEADRLLTRSMVARRLGKSTATVRAIEGTLLNPAEGPRGVRLFDADEVGRLAGKSLGVAAQSLWLRSCSKSRSTQLRSLMGRTVPAQTDNRTEIELLRRQVVALRNENAKLTVILEELAAVPDG
jgi:DNA-binding transcriptional MerR regulator